MNSIKVEKDELDPYGEAYSAYHDAKQAMNIKSEKVSDTEEEEGPVPITFPEIKAEPENYIKAEKDELDPYGEAYSAYHDADQTMNIKTEEVSDIEVEDGPVQGIFPEMMAEPEKCYWTELRTVGSPRQLRRFNQCSARVHPVRTYLQFDFDELHHPERRLAVEENQAMDGPSMDMQKTNKRNKMMVLRAANNDQIKIRTLIPAERQDKTKKSELLPAVECEPKCSTLPNSSKSKAALKNEARIRRPPNAYIIFAKEWRKKLTAQNPGETSKQISGRLGAMWKSLKDEKRELYTDMSRKLDAEHKKKYPDYVYCPNAARKQKALRAEARGLKRRIAKSDKTNTALPDKMNTTLLDKTNTALPDKTNTAIRGTDFNQQASQEQQVGVTVFHETVYPKDTKEVLILPKPGPSWMFVQQEGGHQVAMKGCKRHVGQNMIQGCTYVHLDVDINPYQQSTSHSA